MSCNNFQTYSCMSNSNQTFNCHGIKSGKNLFQKMCKFAIFHCKNKEIPSTDLSKRAAMSILKSQTAQNRENIFDDFLTLQCKFTMGYTCFVYSVIRLVTVLAPTHAHSGILSSIIFWDQLFCIICTMPWIEDIMLSGQSIMSMVWLVQRWRLPKVQVVLMKLWRSTTRFLEPTSQLSFENVET